MSITRMGPDTRSGALGLGFAVLSAATFSTSGTFADSLMSTGWSPGAVVTLRITIAAVLLAAPALAKLRGRWRLLRRGVPAVLGYGVLAVAGAQVFFFNAVQHLDVGVALLLEYLGIVLVVGWMWLAHGQRPRRLTVAGVVAALAGLALVLHPGAGLDAVGVLWGLSAAVGLAVYFVVSARTQDVLPPVVTAWVGLTVGALALIACDTLGVLPFRARTLDVRLAGRAVSWLVPVAGLSLVAAAIAYAAGIAAARRLGATVASFVGLTEVLFAVVFAWVVLGQAPAPVQIAGGVVVLAGIAAVRLDQLRADALTARV